MLSASRLAALRRVLVVKLSSLGDVVHVTPALRALRRACPAARITMVVERRFADLVRPCPWVDEVIEVPVPAGRLATWLEAWRGLAGRRRPRFDVAIDFQGRRRSALWVYASGARLRVGRAVGEGWGDGWRPGWPVVVRPDRDRHAVRVCADVAEAVGVPVESLAPALWVTAEADRRCATRLAERGLPPEGFVLVHPFTRWASKNWPLDRYQAVARRLVRDRGVVVVVSVAPGEAAGHPGWEPDGEPRGRIAVLDDLPLAEALALFRRARLMVSGDTGPLHCAAALGVPVVALFGPTWPECSGPFGPGHRVIQASRPPSPAAYRTDVDGRHIRAIDVATVHRAVLETLEAPPVARPAPVSSPGGPG